MTQLLKPIRQRIYAIVFDGYGTAGERGSDAAARAITAGRFRPTLDQAPLDEPQLDLTGIDRACSFKWLGNRDMNEPYEVLAAQQYRVAHFELTNAVVQGVGNEQFLHDAALDADEQTYAVEYPDERALSDAETIATALGFTLLSQSANTDDPCLIDVHREGESSLITGPGVVLCRTVYLLNWRFNSSVAHNPP